MHLETVDLLMIEGMERMRVSGWKTFLPASRRREYVESGRCSLARS